MFSYDINLLLLGILGMCYLLLFNICQAVKADKLIAKNDTKKYAITMLVRSKRKFVEK